MSLLSTSVSLWRVCPSGYYLWLRINFPFSPHSLLYLAVCYFPPAGRHAYSAAQSSAPFDALFDDCLAARSLGHVLILGDFNARTGSRVPSYDFALTAALSTDLARSRVSPDTSINSFGRDFLTFCCDTDLSILHGQTLGNSSLLSSYGCPTGSVVDYALASRSVLLFSPTFLVCPLVPEADH